MAWNPQQYHRFQRERAQPFEDLAAQILPFSAQDPSLVAPRLLDLGCGTGELTRQLADRLGAKQALGLDSSPEMLAKAEAQQRPGLTFQLGEIQSLTSLQGWEVVFSHAALQWVPDHLGLLARLLPTLDPGAQIAWQMPDNYAHPSHVVLAEQVASPRWQPLLGPPRPVEVLPLERYAEILWAHGLHEQRCQARVYGHVLEDADAVVEWMRGTALTAYLPKLEPGDQAAFVAEYRQRLAQREGGQRPYFFAFRRVLLWGRKS